MHEGVITSATVLTFILFLDQFFAPIQQLSQVFDQWQSALASMTKINELMHTEVSTPDAGAPGRAGSRAAARSSSRTCTSPTRTPASRSCTASTSRSRRARRSRWSARPAPGKSTIVKLVARFYDVTGGQVLIDGTPITDLDLRAYRRRLGYVPQEPFLFSGTIRDNIAYGRPDASDAEVEQAARAVGAHEFVAELPGGYLHPVTERGRSLSAGQTQLICLARALLVDPSILLLDEATANLDLSTEARVQRAMGLVATGRTTLLIAHRLPTARSADRIVVVDGGADHRAGQPRRAARAQRSIRGAVVGVQRGTHRGLTHPHGFATARARAVLDLRAARRRCPRTRASSLFLSGSSIL